MTEPATLPQLDAEHEERRCQHAGCRVPPALLYETADADGVAGWTCNSHDENPLMQEARRMARQRGAMATARHFKRGLDPGELGPLQTLEDAQRHLAISCEAVSTGRISPAVSNAIDRKVSLFLKARDLDVRETRLTRLEAELERLKRAR